MGGVVLWGAQMEMYTSFRSCDLITQCLLALSFIWVVHFNRTITGKRYLESSLAVKSEEFHKGAVTELNEFKFFIKNGIEQS